MVVEANKVSRLVVHIGAHKTGTTAIQEFSCKNTKFLADRGVFYPANLLEEYPAQHSAFRFLYQHGRRQDVVEAIRRTWKGARDEGCGATFLSGEELCNLDRREIRHFASVARRYYKELSFVYVVRNRKQYLLSHYKHFLIYGDGKSELSFLKSPHPPSPNEVLSRWKSCFSRRCQVINYNNVESGLVPAFYADVFGMEVGENPRENYSLDLLTLQVYNTFLKDLKGSGMERVVWEFTQEFPPSRVFPVEAELADELAARFPTKGWSLPELESREVLLEDWKPREAPEDPIRTCDRMLALFGNLRAHFASHQEALLESD